MKDIPRIVDRDMAHAIGHEVVGKESGHIHKLMCRLRHAGATLQDLISMRTAPDYVFTEFLARVRGIDFLKPLGGDICFQDPDLRLINLDFEFNATGVQSLFNLSDCTIKREVFPTKDSHLGIWPANSINSGFGNMRMSVKSPVGSRCVDGNTFCLGELFDQSLGYVQLNMAMALWLSRGGRDDLVFDHLDASKISKGHSVYFLGTVWWEKPRHENVVGRFWSPVLETNNKAGGIHLKIRQVPQGFWPENCSVAVLEPIEQLDG